ncbi:MAG: isoprenylcysteine carboxylmethyltransferase family protein [Pseudomonadota bacterium]|nr:isoprenylcysteine carboxylmethyltransferase family protein [Pseudomonadota bacterium]
MATSIVGAAWRTLSTGGPLATIAGGLQVVVACALLLRAPERRAARTRDLAAALPSLLVAGVVMAAAAQHPWSTLGLGVAMVGVCVAVAGIVSLGPSFAVLPGVRALRTGGLYRWVRHPVYLGEGIVFLAAAAQLGWSGAAAVVTLVPLLVWRIQVEERLLSREPSWAEWAARVRWRLLPGAW